MCTPVLRNIMLISCADFYTTWGVFLLFTSSFSSFTLLFAGQGWVSSKGIVGSSWCPPAPHISPPCPLIPVEKNAWGRKGALLVPGIPVHLALTSDLASVDIRSWANYIQRNPNQAGLSISCPLFFVTGAPIFLCHFCHIKASWRIRAFIHHVEKFSCVLLCHCCSADQSQSPCFTYPLRKFREVQSAFSW